MTFVVKVKMTEKAQKTQKFFQIEFTAKVI
jgi:hypothetical protein